MPKSFEYPATEGVALHSAFSGKEFQRGGQRLKRHRHVLIADWRPKTNLRADHLTLFHGIRQEIPEQNLRAKRPQFKPEEQNLGLPPHKY